MKTSSFGGKRKPLIAGLLSTVMLSVVAMSSPAQTAAPIAAGSASTTAASSADRPVLESEFGKATSRVTGTFGRAGTVTGKFTPRRFKNADGRLWAIGQLRATLTRANGDVVGTTTERVVLPVRRAEGAPVNRIGAMQLTDCQILNLVLGPLDLDLLGLKVHLDRVVLRIVATPGPGNLLGNLLCAIAGLLDEGGLLVQVRRILNAVLAILRL
ncbi:MAG: hypothetical protein M3237_00595 [Actinomycetota bacterium]|nr:hypothetical protein [Actinomycetota bacterium]